MLKNTVRLSTFIVLTAAVAIVAITTNTASAAAATTEGFQPDRTVNSWATTKQRNDRQEHRVGPLPWAKGEDPIRESYAGNFPIRQWTTKDGSKADAEMFYWFFPALNPKVKNPPLIIWLQGGPGASSMIGLFYETGPMHVTEDHKLIRNNNTWANDYSMLFVEQPVGTGYSFVDQGGAKKGSKHKKKTRHGGNEVSDDGDDAPEFDDVQEDDDEDARLDEIDEELEKDQEEEAAFFATLPVSDPFDLKVAAASKRNSTNNAEDSDAMFTKSGYVKDQRAVVKDMMVFLDQFYERYPEQLKADLYIAGQSYAGKFIPSIAHAIMERNKKLKAKLPQSVGGAAEAGVEDLEAETGADTEAISKAAPPKKVAIPIKGVSMGNTMTDPITQIQIHADHAYYLGLLTEPQADQMREYQKSAVELVEQGRFLDANRYRGKVFNLFRNSTGNLNTFDIRKGSHGMNWKPMTALLNQPEIKDSLNVFGPRKSYLVQQGAPQQEVDRIERGRRATKYKTDPEVKQAMRGDIMRSTKPLVADLLDNGVKVLAYQGIFDFRDAAAGSTKWIESMDWRGREAFLKTERKIWKVKGFTAGYVNSVLKKDEGLTRIAMLGGGHYTPMDESENSLVMIRHLIEGTPLAEK
ncbi:hypothetical protein EC991_011061 [Linnemannia zychae]|nr:hypothetical protein EC991_011061 [Linnemannia zychae]